MHFAPVLILRQSERALYQNRPATVLARARARRIGVVVEASEGMLGFSLTREPGSLGASFHARSEASPLARSIRASSRSRRPLCWSPGSAARRRAGVTGC
ncbi:MAG: hypothetical protein AMXMBFR80_05070 [Dehalococcoidia bacterium]